MRDGLMRELNAYRPLQEVALTQMLLHGHKPQDSLGGMLGQCKDGHALRGSVCLMLTVIISTASCYGREIFMPTRSAEEVPGMGLGCNPCCNGRGPTPLAPTVRLSLVMGIQSLLGPLVHSDRCDG